MTQSNINHPLLNIPSGTFKITQSSNGSIQIKDVNEPTQGLIKEISNFTYERSEIPQELIDECEKFAIESGETYFIFDNEISYHIKSRYSNNKEDKRDFNLSQLLSTDKFHIGTDLYFREMPSRFSYYDTETKSFDRYHRYNIVVDFFKKMRFEPSEFNLGPEYEQSFILEIRNTDEDSESYQKIYHKYIMRLKPNLFLSISSENFESLSIPIPNIPYIGFFNKSKIIEFIRKNSPSNYKSIIREITIDQILN